jgi:hypothetical protein
MLVFIFIRPDYNAAENIIEKYGIIKRPRNMAAKIQGGLITHNQSVKLPHIPISGQNNKAIN